MTIPITSACFSARLRAVHYFEGPSGRAFSRRRERQAQLCVVLGGCYRAYHDQADARQEIRALAGEAVYWAPETPRIEESLPGHPLTAISIYFVWPEAPAGLPTSCRDRHHLIHDLANRLLSLTRDPARQTLMTQVGDAYLNAMLAEYAALAQASGNRLESALIRYAETHMQHPVRLADLARDAGVSVAHYCRRYKHQTGRSPVSDVRQRKAEHAKNTLMQVPSRSLSTIAQRVGIKDTATLCRLLKQQTGMTVRNIRRLGDRA